MSTLEQLDVRGLHDNTSLLKVTRAVLAVRLTTVRTVSYHSLKVM